MTSRWHDSAFEIASAPVADSPAPGHARHAKARDESGVWRYRAAAGVAVPGALDVSLASRIAAYQIVDPHGEPDGALIPKADVESDSALDFVRSSGHLLRGDEPEHDVYRVSQAIWEEYSGRPVDVAAPEDGEPGLRRQVAIQERELRFARWRQERQLERRTQVVALAAELGMTRRDAAGILGVTSGRVQQLIDDLPPHSRREVDELVAAIEVVLRQLGDVPVGEEALVPSHETWPGVLDDMVDLGLVTRDDSTVAMTDLGDETKLLLHKRRRDQGSQK